MSETKFTPGPWDIGVPNREDLSEIGIHAGDYIIADMCIDAPLGRQDADAHLIAAAPELYEALSRIAAEFEGVEQGILVDFNAEEISGLLSVLAKARGEQ